MSRRHDEDEPAWRRYAWFAALWLGGVGVMALIGAAIRLLMPG